MSKDSSFRYMPILKWKLGEQGALQKIDTRERSLILPLIEFQPLVIKKNDRTATIKSIMNKASGCLGKSGGKTHPVAIDTISFLPGSTTPVKTLRVVCNHFTKDGCQVFPVIYPLMINNNGSELGTLCDYEDIVLRVKVFNYLASQLDLIISEAHQALKNSNVRIHLLLDMNSVVNGDATQLANKMEAFLEAVLHNQIICTVTLAGGSFPYNLTGISRGNTMIPRVEWLVWKKIFKKYREASIRFGDYAVTNPDPLAEIDPLKINPSAAIRYTLEKDWMLIKAGGVRTYGYAQYNELCQLLMTEPNYSQKEFSFGDGKYHWHAQPGSTSGNLTTWRRDATSHHLALTVRNCATQFGI